MTNKNFINDSFLLHNEYAEELYHKYAAPQPIIDYHNHLSPKDIAEDRVFENITQLWIAGDHYKFRAMRTIGIEEKYITGNATDREKFIAWAKTVPHTLRNPLFHWTHLELKRYFDIDELLNEQNAERIYEQVNEMLKQPEFSCRSLLKKMNITWLCTTEDPTDDLRYHRQLVTEGFDIKVSTAFRPDKAIGIDGEGFPEYLEQLGKSAEISINTYDDFCKALQQRISFFHENGCRLSDHGLSYISYSEVTEEEAARIFSKRMQGKALTASETEQFKTAVLLFLGKKYHHLGWVQQFHLGALRNNNKRKLEELGPDTGWDSIGDYTQAETLSQFLNALDSHDKLSKTILYNLNPAYNEVFGSMVGNFNDGSVRGKIQYGSAWWYLDQKDGIIQQLNALSNTGLLSCFIGMLTDSRSFLSFPRHEYFRRVLCNLLGAEMHRGELPADIEMLGQLVADISYNNAKEYFQ